MNNDKSISIENYFISNEFAKALLPLKDLANNDTYKFRNVIEDIIAVVIRYYNFLGYRDDFKINELNKLVSFYCTKYAEKSYRIYLEKQIIDYFSNIYKEKTKTGEVSYDEAKKIIENLSDRYKIYHGFNSSSLDSIKENGINPNLKLTSQEEIDKIDKIFKSHGIDRIFEWQSLNCIGKVSYSKTANVSYDYANRSPEWFSLFVGGGFNYAHDKYNKSAFEENDYEGAKNNLLMLMQNKSFNPDEITTVINFFNKNWEKYANKNPMVVIINEDMTERDKMIEASIIPSSNNIFKINTLLKYIYDDQHSEYNLQTENAIDTSNAAFISLPRTNNLIRQINQQYDLEKEKKEKFSNRESFSAENNLIIDAIQDISNQYISHISKFESLIIKKYSNIPPNELQIKIENAKKEYDNFVFMFSNFRFFIKKEADELKLSNEDELITKCIYKFFESSGLNQKLLQYEIMCNKAKLKSKSIDNEIYIGNYDDIFEGNFGYNVDYISNNLSKNGNVKLSNLAKKMQKYYASINEMAGIYDYKDDPITKKIDAYIINSELEELGLNTEISTIINNGKLEEFLQLPDESISYYIKANGCRYISLVTFLKNSQSLKHGSDFSVDELVNKYGGYERFLNNEMFANAALSADKYSIIKFRITNNPHSELLKNYEEKIANGKMMGIISDYSNRKKFEEICLEYSTSSEVKKYIYDNYFTSDLKGKIDGSIINEEVRLLLEKRKLMSLYNEQNEIDGMNRKTR